MVERGQKLNEIEDQMENMSNEAKQYAQNAQALKNMYKNKKWYQLWTNIFLFYPFQECAYVLQPESSFLSSFFLWYFEDHFSTSFNFWSNIEMAKKKSKLKVGTVLHQMWYLFAKYF